MIDLKKEFRDKYKVTTEEPHESSMISKYYQIIGKRGIVYGWDKENVEMLVQNTHIATRLIRLKTFKLKNDYDDGASFIVPLARIYEAFNIIKPKKRRHLSPEQRQKCIERLATMRSSKKLAYEATSPAEQNQNMGKDA